MTSAFLSDTFDEWSRMQGFVSALPTSFRRSSRCVMRCIAYPRPISRRRKPPRPSARFLPEARWNCFRRSSETDTVGTLERRLRRSLHSPALGHRRSARPGTLRRRVELREARAARTPAATTGTWQSCWAPPACWRLLPGSLPGASVSCSSPRRKRPPGARR